MLDEQSLPYWCARQHANTFLGRRGKAHRYAKDWLSTNATRLLIGKVIWKGRDLLSDASGLKRNLLRKPHMADLVRWPTLSYQRNIFFYFSRDRARSQREISFHSSRSPVNPILHAAGKRFDVDARLQPSLVVRRVYNLSCHVKRTRLFVKAAIINWLLVARPRFNYWNAGSITSEACAEIIPHPWDRLLLKRPNSKVTSEPKMILTVKVRTSMCSRNSVDLPRDNIEKFVNRKPTQSWTNRVFMAHMFQRTSKTWRLI